VDGEGRIYRQLYGDSFAAPQFVGPLVELLANTPRPPGDLGALLEQVKLLCTVYDPASGKYRVNYVVLIELLVGASVVLGGIAWLLLEWRRRSLRERTIT
jgi:protein SCO1/2